MPYKLAFSNIKKSFKDYAVYFITLMLGVAIFYSFNTLGAQAQYFSSQSKEVLLGTQRVMGYLTAFLSAILGFLMVYANNYLVKRRKHELGIYQLLGMNQRQVARVLTLETIIAGIFSFLAGILAGVLMSQLMLFATAHMFRESVASYSFMFSVDASKTTASSFLVIFAIMVLLNVRAIRKVSLMELMQAGRKNQVIKMKNPVVSLLLFAVSLALIGWSYIRLLSHGFQPLLAAADDYSMRNPFLTTTFIMVAGTVLFFYSVASAWVVLAEKWKSHYYHGLNMFSLRQLSSKLNTATGSLVIIALLLFFVATSTITGLSLLGSTENMMERFAPYGLSMEFGSRDVRNATVSSPQAVDDQILSDAKAAGIDIVGSSNAYALVHLYESDVLPENAEIHLADLERQSRLAMPKEFASLTDEQGKGFALQVIRNTDYRALCKVLGVKPVDVKSNQYLILSNMGDVLPGYYSKVMARHTPLALFGKTLYPATTKCLSGPESVIFQQPMGMNNGTLVVSDSLVSETLKPSTVVLDADYPKGKVPSEKTLDRLIERKSSGKTADFLGLRYKTQDIVYSEMTQNTAIISYMSIYTGIVMVLACAVVISIQLLSQASDSRKSYETIDKLGATRKLSTRSLLKQNLVYFLLPLILAACHSYVALKVLLGTLKAVWPITFETSSITIIACLLLVYLAYFVGTYQTSKSIVFKKR